MWENTVKKWKAYIKRFTKFYKIMLGKITVLNLDWLIAR